MEVDGRGSRVGVWFRFRFRLLYFEKEREGGGGGFLLLVDKVWVKPGTSPFFDFGLVK